MQSSNQSVDFFCQIDRNNLNEVYLLKSQQISNQQINTIVRTKQIQLVVNYQEISINIDGHVIVNQFESIKETIKEIQLFQQQGKSFNILLIPRRDDTAQVYKLLAVYCELVQLQIPEIIKKGLISWNFNDECHRIVEDINQAPVHQGNYTYYGPPNLSTNQSFPKQLDQVLIKQEVSEEVKQDVSLTNPFQFPQLKPIEFKVNNFFRNQRAGN